MGTTGVFITEKQIEIYELEAIVWGVRASFCPKCKKKKSFLYYISAYVFNSIV